MNRSEHEKLRSEVDEIIGYFMDEFNKTIKLLKNDNSLIRMRFLVAFSFAEVMCGIFDKFYCLNLGNENLMKKWFKEYCLTDKNDVYKKHKYFNKIDESYLYEFRCAIIHAFALPEQKDKRAIMFPNGPETAKNIVEIDKKFSEAGYDPIFISPDSLTGLFIKGGMFLIKEVLSIRSVKSMKGLLRVRKELHRRGAAPIPLEESYEIH